MNFRIIEIIETEKFQYLRIYKNASQTIMRHMENTFGKEGCVSTVHLTTKKPRWVVVRDPYERFVSGLSYDMERNNVKVEDLNLKKLFTANEFHFRNVILGSVNHGISQIPFLMNTNPSHYIDINDLNIFLKMHFKEVKTENLYKNKNKKTKEIEDYFSKEEIMKYLNTDYYIYNHIKNSPFLWEWQHGKIF